MICKKVGLSFDELEYMTIGSAIEFIEEYVNDLDSDKKAKTRKATQDDFDSF